MPCSWKGSFIGSWHWNVLSRPKGLFSWLCRDSRSKNIRDARQQQICGSHAAENPVWVFVMWSYSWTETFLHPASKQKKMAVRNQTKIFNTSLGGRLPQCCSGLRNAKREGRHKSCSPPCATASSLITNLLTPPLATISRRILWSSLNFRWEQNAKINSVDWSVIDSFYG